jgi:hypothetical protein
VAAFAMAAGQPVWHLHSARAVAAGSPVDRLFANTPTCNFALVSIEQLVQTEARMITGPTLIKPNKCRTLPHVPSGTRAEVQGGAMPHSRHPNPNALLAAPSRPSFGYQRNGEGQGGRWNERAMSPLLDRWMKCYSARRPRAHKQGRQAVPG